MKIARDYLIKQMESNGFWLAKEHNFLPYQYFRVFVPSRLSATRLSRNLSTQNYRNTNFRGAAMPQLGKPKFPRMGIDVTSTAAAINAGVRGLISARSDGRSGLTLIRT
jgi:hypothetical protein